MSENAKVSTPAGFSKGAATGGSDTSNTYPAPNRLNTPAANAGRRLRGAKQNKIGEASAFPTIKTNSAPNKL